MSSLVNFMHLILIILVILTSISDSADVADLATLKQVHVLFRHGDRAPIVPYPKDPGSSKAHWLFGYGQLTKEGLVMHQKLGKWFRERYGSFLSRHWNHSEIEVISTDKDRTINSAQANLQGLYSTQEDEDKFDPSLNWSPVPIRALPHDYDKLMNLDQSCPRAVLEAKNLQKDKKVKEITASCDPLFKLIYENLGVNMSTVEDIDFVHDYFYIHKVHSIPLPDWVKPHMPFMKDISEFSFEMMAYNTVLKRLRGGPLIKKIIEDMEKKSLNSSLPKFVMYSAHDTTVACNLMTLGLFNHILPPYASTVIYELHLIDSQYIVKLFYRNDTAMIQPAFPLTLPQCTTNCPLSQFRTLMTPLLPVNFSMECQVDNGTLYSFNSIGDTLNGIREAFNHNDTVCVALSATLLVLTIIILTLLITLKKRFSILHQYSLLSPHE